jgi:hypothetical protein
MNVKRYVLASLAAFVFIYLAEFVFHGLIMSSSYDQYLEFLRPASDQSAYMPIMAVGFLVLAFGFCFIFVQGYEGRGIWEGLRFGFYVGVAFGVSGYLINFAVFPWPTSWLIIWSIGGMVIMMLAGVVIALIYRPLPR